MRGLILAAGLGERLRPLTLKKAKPAVEFLNIPMLGFPFFWLDTLGLKQLVFNTHYLPESIRHAAMHVIDPAVPLHFSHEPHILGSGGGSWNSRTFLEGDQNFIVANGDGVILCEHLDVMEQMLAFHVQRDALATLLVCPLEGVGTKLPGVWMDSAGEIVNFGKTPKYDYAECFHYASYMILSKRIWDYLPEGSSNILYEVIEPLVQSGQEKAYGFRVDKMLWFETGNATDYLAATRRCFELMNEGSALGACARKIIQRMAPNSELNGHLLVADNASVDVNARFEGFNVIGENAVVSANVRLKNSVLLPDVHLNSGREVIDQVLI